MSRSLYVAAAGPETGKSMIVLGVLDAMTRRVGRVAVFRPVVRTPATHGTDPLLALIRSQFPNVLPDEASLAASVGLTYDDVHADPDGAVATIVERFRAVERTADAVLVIGTDYTDVGAPTELSFNGRVAVNLGSPVLLVVTGAGLSPADVAASVDLAEASLEAQSCEVLGVIANRVAPADVEAVRAALLARQQVGEITEVVPDEPLLVTPTVSQIVDACSATVIAGSREHLDDDVRAFIVAAMTLPRVLDALPPAGLIIVPGDRPEIMVGVLMAHRAQTFPRLSAILMTGGVHPEPVVQRLVDGLGSGLPIAVTPLNTFRAATAAAATRGSLLDRVQRKTERALALFAGHVNGGNLLDRLDLARSEAVTPIMFEHDLVERARAKRARIVLPEGTEPRVVTAAAQVLHREIADLVLLGDPGEIQAVADKHGVSIAGAQLLDPRDEELRGRLAEEYVRLRAHKGVTPEIARETVLDVSYAGTLMVALGMADGMVSGAVHTTAHTIRPAFEVIRAVPGLTVVSSVFFMCLADRVLVYGDCAVNPDPTAEQLADIAVSSARTAAAFGVEPRVAMLSYSTGSSGAGADVEKVRTATELARQKAPDLQIEGPIQYDAAIDAGVASTKLPDSVVAGRATVFVFPDLNTGNNTYKAVQRSADAVAVGPVLQGLRRPVNDLSRGATVRDIVTTIAITAVQAGLPPIEAGGPAATEQPAVTR